MSQGHSLVQVQRNVDQGVAKLLIVVVIGHSLRDAHNIIFHSPSSLDNGFSISNRSAMTVANNAPRDCDGGWSYRFRDSQKLPANLHKQWLLVSPSLRAAIVVLLIWKWPWSASRKKRHPGGSLTSIAAFAPTATTTPIAIVPALIVGHCGWGLWRQSSGPRA